MKSVGKWPCCISFEAICLTSYFAREMRQRQATQMSPAMIATGSRLAVIFNANSTSFASSSVPGAVFVSIVDWNERIIENVVNDGPTRMQRTAIHPEKRFNRSVAFFIAAELVSDSGDGGRRSLSIGIQFVRIVVNGTAIQSLARCRLRWRSTRDRRLSNTNAGAAANSVA